MKQNKKPKKLRIMGHHLLDGDVYSPFRQRFLLTDDISLGFCPLQPV